MSSVFTYRATPASSTRLTHPPNRWLTLSLLVGALLAAGVARDGGLGFFVLVVLCLASLRWNIGPLALVGLFFVGVELRFFAFAMGTTDVDAVTRAAIDLVLAGGNPYGIGYDVTNKLDAPFVYGPLVLLWYLPASDPRVLDMLVSGLIVGVLAVRGQPLGLAIWATSPIFVRIASDGSNDTSAGLLLMVALVVLERLPRAGAFLVGVAAGFKPYALAWLPAILGWAGAVSFAAGILGVALAWLPAVLIWGVGPIIESLRLADVNKRTPYFSLGEVLSRLGHRASRDLLNAAAYVLGAIAALVSVFTVRTHAAVVISGVVVYLVTLYAAHWATPAYLVAIGPVLCWYLDGWLGGDSTRIKWPTDPVGRFTAAVDRRWPRVDSVADDD